MKKLAFYAASCALLTAALPFQAAAVQTEAAAPATVAVEAGNTVYDPEGATVGTIASVDAANAVLTIGEKQVALPLSAFGKNEKGLLIGSTLAQLEASLAEQEAAAASKLAAALVPDAQVHSVNGSEVLAKIKSVDGDAVILTTPQGDVGLPKSAFFMPAHGLSTAFTAEQFKKAVADAAAAAAPAAPAAAN